MVTARRNVRVADRSRNEASQKQGLYHSRHTCQNKDLTACTLGACCKHSDNLAATRVCGLGGVGC
jgi:hypothetical protein